MTASTEPNSGLKYGWDRGESGWDTENDANLLTIGRVLSQCSILDRDLTAPPGGESDGDRYIVAATATGAWASHEDDIAVYTGSGWAFYTPVQGWLTYIEDEAKISVFKTATGWSAGVSI